MPRRNEQLRELRNHFKRSKSSLYLAKVHPAYAALHNRFPDLFSGVESMSDHLSELIKIMDKAAAEVEKL